SITSPSLNSMESFVVNPRFLAIPLVMILIDAVHAAECAGVVPALIFRVAEALIVSCPCTGTATGGFSVMSLSEKEDAMVVRWKQSCDGCGVPVGKMHKKACREAFCWYTQEHCVECRHCRQFGDRFPFTGDLENVFAFHNHYEFDLGEYDLSPHFRKG